MGNILCPESPVEIDVSRPLLEPGPPFSATGNPKEIEINASETITKEVYTIDIKEILPLCDTCGNKKHRQRILSKDPHVVSMKVYLCLNCKPKG